MLKQCIGDFPRPITVEEWNEERKKHHDLSSIYFSGQLDLLCNSCGAKVVLQGHYWFDHNYPYCQAVCSNKGCGKSTYVMS